MSSLRLSPWKHYSSGGCHWVFSCRFPGRITGKAITEIYFLPLPSPGTSSLSWKHLFLNFYSFQLCNAHFKCQFSEMVLILFLNIVCPSGNSQGLCSVNPQCYQLGVQLPKSQHFPGRNSEWHTVSHPLSTKGYFCSIDVSFKQFNCEISLKMSKTMPQVLVNAGSFLAARWDKVIITVPTKGYFAFCFSRWFPGSSDWWRIHLQCARPGFPTLPWVGKIPWRRERLPTPVFWPREIHELCSPWGHNGATSTFSRWRRKLVGRDQGMISFWLCWSALWAKPGSSQAWYISNLQDVA